MEKAGNEEDAIRQILEEAEVQREGRCEKGQEEARSILCFRLGIEHYAVEMEEVREIVQKIPIYHVPGTKDHVLGIINLRGEIIAIIDPKRRLSTGSGTLGAGSGTSLESYEVVIIKGFGEPIGILVDEVVDIVKPDTEEEEHTERVIRSRIYSDSANHGSQKLIGLLNLKELLLGAA